MFKTLFVALAAIPALTVVSIENATAGTRQEMTGKAGRSDTLTFQLSFVSEALNSKTIFETNDLSQSAYEIASLSDPSGELRIYFSTPEVKYGQPIDNNALFFMQVDKMTTSSISKTPPKTEE